MYSTSTKFRWNPTNFEISFKLCKLDYLISIYRARNLISSCTLAHWHMGQTAWPHHVAFMRYLVHKLSTRFFIIMQIRCELYRISSWNLDGRGRTRLCTCAQNFSMVAFPVYEISLCTHGRTDRRTDRQTDRRTDRHTHAKVTTMSLLEQSSGETKMMAS